MSNPDTLIPHEHNHPPTFDYFWELIKNKGLPTDTESSYLSSIAINREHAQVLFNMFVRVWELLENKGTINLKKFLSEFVNTLHYISPESMRQKIDELVESINSSYKSGEFIIAVEGVNKSGSWLLQLLLKAGMNVPKFVISTNTREDVDSITDDDGNYIYWSINDIDQISLPVICLDEWALSGTGITNEVIHPLNNKFDSIELLTAILYSTEDAISIIDSPLVIDPEKLPTIKNVLGESKKYIDFLINWFNFFYEEYTHEASDYVVYRDDIERIITEGCLVWGFHKIPDGASFPSIIAYYLLGGEDSIKPPYKLSGYDFDWRKAISK